MSIPAALVTVRIRRIQNLSAAAMSGTTRVFAVATIGRRVFGRSRPIPATASEHDLEAEPVPWEDVVQIATREDIRITLKLFDDHDRGTASPVERGAVHEVLRFPYDQTTVTLGSTIRVELSVSTRFVPGAATADVARSQPGGQANTRVSVPGASAATIAVVELQNILGLYRPRPGDVVRRSGGSVGYRSEDHAGRVFTNTALNGRYQRYTHQIELRARIHVRRGQLPQGTSVRWRVVDVDNTFDADPTVARQWLHDLDPNDYDAQGTPRGARGGDNRTSSRRSSPWEAVTGFTVDNPSATEATTNIVGGQSAVVLHCPSAAGDCFIVEADLVFPGGNAVSYEARTGVITMWHRVFVDYARMRRALPLPVARIAPVFEPAFIEMNFAPERPIDDNSPRMAARADDFDNSLETFIQTHFPHPDRSGGGWFFLVAAPLSYADEEPPILYPRGPATLVSAGGEQYLDIPVPLASDPSSVMLYWRDGTTARSGGFLVRSAAPYGTGVRIVLQGNDFTPDFTAGDGSGAHAYSRAFHVHPQGRVEGGTLVPPGYGAPSAVEAEVQGEGGDTAGTSPYMNVNGTNYFAGRTFIFTHHRSFAEQTSNGRHVLRPGGEDELVLVIGHELCHAFGMPHRCGLFDVRSRASTTSGNNACLMNYVWHPLLDATRREILLGTDDRVGAAFCGRHLRELRRVKLQENQGLRSVGW